MNQTDGPYTVQLLPFVSDLFLFEHVLCHLGVAEVSGEISGNFHRAQILSLSGQPVSLDLSARECIVVSLPKRIKFFSNYANVHAGKQLAGVFEVNRG